MILNSDSEILEAVKAAAAKYEMSPSVLIGLGSALADWRKYAITETASGPWPHTIEEADITQETLQPWPEWVAELAAPGSKWERLHWPDGTVTIRLVSPRRLVLASVRMGDLG